MAQSSGGKGGAAAVGGGSLAPSPPPEMPRELGAADGVLCKSDLNRPPTKTCEVGARCCPNDEGGRHEEVCTTDAKCPACDGVNCAQLLCDGPEDCSGGLYCCYIMAGSCEQNPDTCTAAAPSFEGSTWATVECKARCVTGGREFGQVVCKDDRDCPGPYKAGRCQELNISDPPNGLKICSGG